MAVTAQGAAAKHVSFERDRGVYQVLVTQGLAHAVVTVGADEQRTDRLLRVFRTLADESIPIFLVKLHHTEVSFALEEAQIPLVESCLAAQGFEISTRRNLVLLTVVASSMRDLTGVMVSIADSLQEAGARLFGVGDSHNSVQCLIDGARLLPAISKLKETFSLEDQVSVQEGKAVE
jgi:aspartokinase